MIKTYNILDSVAASSADIVLQNGILSITGAPKIPFGRVMSNESNPYLTEVREVVTVTPTAANSTAYRMVIKQFNKAVGRDIEEAIEYTTAASGDTATTICNAFRAIIATRPNLKLVASGTTTLVLTATSGYPLMTVTSTAAGVLAQATTFVNGAGTGLTAQTGLTLTISSGVVTAPATSHGLTTGMTVTIADSALTFTDRNGVAVVGSYRGRITVTTANAFTMDDVVVTGTPGAAGGSYTIHGQAAVGTYANLVARGITGGTSGNLYEEWRFKYEDLSPVSGQSQIMTHSVFVNASDGDFAALRVTFNNLRGGGTAASATTANPEADAVS